MKLNALMDNFGARKDVKRVGRGIGSGKGKTSGKGHKGQKARSGAKGRAVSQGGQMHILRRFPKFGFNNPFSVNYVTINLGDIERFIKDGRIDSKKEINLEALLKSKILNREKSGLKILGKGEIKTTVNIVADAWSVSAEKAIVSAGGTIKASEKAIQKADRVIEKAAIAAAKPVKPAKKKTKKSGK